MPTKLTFEFVYNYFKDHGCELLEKEYINNRTKMRYKCSCLSEGYINYDNFKSGHRCKSCAIKTNVEKRKYTYDYVYSYFKKHGCVLLEKEYINSKTLMKYKCKCGNISKIIFNCIQQGQYCRSCSGSEKLTYEYVYNYFKEQGCELLETEYIDSKTLMEYKCKDNHRQKITFHNFKSGYRCRECYLENNYGENNPRWNPDRTRVSRTRYLSFDLRKINMLNDDPNHNNYLLKKEDYNIDHIFPRVAFIDNNLDNIYSNKIIKEICNSRNNLQIIPKIENSSKAGKYNKDEFINWFENKIKEL